MLIALLVFMVENLALNGIELKCEDILKNGRPFFFFNSCKDTRDRIEKLSWSSVGSKEDFVDYVKKQDLSGIEFFDSKKNFPQSFLDYCNCWDWAFDRVGLSHYTDKEKTTIVDELARKDFCDIARASSVEKGNIIMYYDSKRTHFGVVDEVGEEISVLSKWGSGNVYRHLLEAVPSLYGSHVMFFEKR